jgi:hypothetical protein
MTYRRHRQTAQQQQLGETWWVAYNNADWDNVSDGIYLESSGRVIPWVAEGGRPWPSFDAGESGVGGNDLAESHDHVIVMTQ